MQHIWVHEQYEKELRSLYHWQWYWQQALPAAAVVYVIGNDYARLQSGWFWFSWWSTNGLHTIFCDSLPCNTTWSRGNNDTDRIVQVGQYNSGARNSKLHCIFIQTQLAQHYHKQVYCFEWFQDCSHVLV